MPYKDPKKKVEWGRRHYLANSKEMNAYGSKYNKAHRKEINRRLKIYYKNHKDKRTVIGLQNHKSRLKLRFGLSIAEYNEMFAKQNGCCAICGIHQVEFKRRLAVDHDHKTNVIRGLLCLKCNTALGIFENIPNFAEKVEEYLIQ